MQNPTNTPHTDEVHLTVAVKTTAELNSIPYLRQGMEVWVGQEQKLYRYSSGNWTASANDDSKLDKVTTPGTPRVYTIGTSGEQTVVPYSSSVDNSNIVARTPTGQILVPTTPDDAQSAVARDWVLSRIASVNTADGSNRGVVWNAFTPTTIWSIANISAVTITAAGTNYSVQDSIQIQGATDGSELDALLVVTSVNATGGVTGLSLSSGGIFEQDRSGTFTNPLNVTNATGNSSGLSLTITTTQNPATILSSISSPTQGDSVIVMHDELRSNEAYWWLYADQNGDGHSDWIRGAKALSTERDFTQYPIQIGEIDQSVFTAIAQLHVQTTAPVADNPAWLADNSNYQVVFLTSQPAARYNGYLYFIQ